MFALLTHVNVAVSSSQNFGDLFRTNFHETQLITTLLLEFPLFSHSPADPILDTRISERSQYFSLQKTLNLKALMLQISGVENDR